MELADWRTVIEKDFPEIGEATSETIENIEREGAIRYVVTSFPVLLLVNCPGQS